MSDDLHTRSFSLEPAPVTHFGWGLVAEVGALVRGIAPRALLVTDAGIERAGLADRVRGPMDHAGVAVTTFADITPNPTSESVGDGATAAVATQAGVVVALGGGSVLDAAKAVALAAGRRGAEDPDAPGLPVVAVPTTAGTGSETNGFGVITDVAAGRKTYVGHDSVVPRIALLDPGLTVGLPAAGTAAVGVDALSHALESLMSRRRNPHARALGLEAVTMIAAHLPRAVADGGDREARSQLLLAAHLAGLAMRSTGLGLAHAIAHPLGARLDAVHGVALGAVLGRVLRFNRPAVTDELAAVGRALGVPPDADAAIAAVEELVRSITAPVTLADLGVDEANRLRIVDDALTDPVIDNTPRMPGRDELVSLLDVG